MKNEFLNSPMNSILGRRTITFHAMVSHLESCKSGYIIETGTARQKGNWVGDGQSTLIWDWVAERRNDIKVVSIDKEQRYIDIAKEQTKHVDYICNCSVVALNLLPISIVNQTRLLYLDSFDWSEEKDLESSLHHLCELPCVWRDLPEGCMIVVDDRHSDYKGKHWLVESFMKKLSIGPCFKGYQIGWIKPKESKI